MLKNIFCLKKNNIQYHLIHRLLENKYGHKLSRDLKSPVDANGNEIPWFTYPAFEFINQFDLSQKTIFEWGSGNSSVYFAKRSKQIISIEHDEAWFNKQQIKLLPNQQLIHLNDNSYYEAILSNDQLFDIVIVDGILRDECLKIAMNKITEGGMLILDNADRHPEASKKYRDNGYTQIDFHGLGPINEYAWTTSIFFKTLQLSPISIQPTVPIGGGY
jgi:hypothetical protein